MVYVLATSHMLSKPDLGIYQHTFHFLGSLLACKAEAEIVHSNKTYARMGPGHTAGYLPLL